MSMYPLDVHDITSTWCNHPSALCASCMLPLRIARCKGIHWIVLGCLHALGGSGGPSASPSVVPSQKGLCSVRNFCTTAQAARACHHPRVTTYSSQVCESGIEKTCSNLPVCLLACLQNCLGEGKAVPLRMHEWSAVP